MGREEDLQWLAMMSQKHALGDPPMSVEPAPEDQVCREGDLTPEQLREIAAEYDKRVKRIFDDLKKGMLAQAKSAVSSAGVRWDTFKRNRDAQSIVSRICEWKGGVDFPPATLKKRAEVAVKALEAAIGGGDLGNVQSTISATEGPINEFVHAVDRYYKGILGGGESMVTILTWTKTAGFVSLGVLATIGTGGAAANALVAKGLITSGGYASAGVAAAVGGAISGEVDAIATNLGRGAAGVKVEWGELVWKPAKGALFGFALGPAAKGIGRFVPDKAAKAVFEKGLMKGSEIAPVVQRLGVQGTRAAIEQWWKSKPKSEVDAIESKVYQRIGPGATEEQIAEVMAEELILSGAIERALQTYGASLSTE